MLLTCDPFPEVFFFSFSGVLVWIEIIYDTELNNNVCLCILRDVFVGPSLMRCLLTTQEPVPTLPPFDGLGTFFLLQGLSPSFFTSHKLIINIELYHKKSPSISVLICCVSCMLGGTGD